MDDKFYEQVLLPITPLPPGSINENDIFFFRPHQQLEAKERFPQNGPVPDVDMTNKRAVAKEVVSSALLCDCCAGDISHVEELKLVRPVRDLCMDGFFAQDYEGMVFCSPGCLISMFHACETEYIADAMVKIASVLLERTQRYPPESFTCVKRGSRSGKILGVSEKDQEEDVHSRDTVTKRRNNRA